LVKTRPMTVSQMTVVRYEAGAGCLRFAYLGKATRVVLDIRVLLSVIVVVMLKITIEVMEMAEMLVEVDVKVVGVIVFATVVFNVVLVVNNVIVIVLGR